MTTKELKEPLLGAKKQPAIKKEGKADPNEENYEHQSIWKVFNFAFPILWNRSGCCIRVEIVFVFFFIALAKLVNSIGPLFLKYAVDILEAPGMTMG